MLLANSGGSLEPKDVAPAGAKMSVIPGIFFALCTYIPFPRLSMIGVCKLI
jgi:hypothetical protein